MKALFYTGPNASEIREADAPTGTDDMPVIDVAFCGICGSDMHAWHGHDPRRVPPLVLGHEVVGTVRTGPRAGERVALNPLMFCGTCSACTSGAVHLCPNREMIGMQYPGGFAEQVAIRPTNMITLPDELSFQRAALVEPLACAVHAVRLGLAYQQTASGQAPDQTRVTVLGGGAIGLLCARVFQDRGVQHLAIAETNADRAAMVRAATGAETYNPLETSGPVSDIVLDAVGMGATRKAASEIVRPGGTIVHIGLQDDAPGLDTRRMTLQEIAFIGTYCYTPADFADAVTLLAEGRVTEDGWSEVRPLTEGARSFEDVHEGVAPPKIILQP